jgi:ribose transport system ATP-binding protein
MSENYILQVKGISKAFGVTKANQNVSFDIKPGELRMLAGENGSGKSTIISQIVGIEKPDEGEMIFLGKPYAPQSPTEAGKAGIGFVVQELGLIDDFTAGLNMFLGSAEELTTAGVMNIGKMNKLAKEAIERLGFKNVPMFTKAVNLSIEKRKIIEITKALKDNPKLLILDETTQSLSHDTKKRLYEIIDEKRAEGVAILMITHDIEEMCELGDSITILRDGSVVKTLQKDEISVDAVKQLMVGRDIGTSYYREDTEPSYGDEVVLKVENLGEKGKFQNVSFELHKGEILGFCGLSDAGIHDVGKALFALSKTNDGKITIPSTGTEIKTPLDATRSKMAYVPKDRDIEALMMNAPIISNLYMPSVDEMTGKLLFVSPKKRRQIAEKAKEQLSIKCTSVNQIVSALSGGNKQKVNLGRWLVKDIDILVMDCPTRGVDIGVKAYIYNLMKQMKEKGISMIIISDELTEILGMSDRVVVMKEGKIASIVDRSENLTESSIVEVMI